MGCGLSGRLNPRGCSATGEQQLAQRDKNDPRHHVPGVIPAATPRRRKNGRGFRASKRATSAWSSAMVARTRSNPACVSTATTSRMSAIPAYPAPPSLP